MNTHDAFIKGQCFQKILLSFFFFFLLPIADACQYTYPFLCLRGQIAAGNSAPLPFTSAPSPGAPLPPVLFWFTWPTLASLKAVWTHTPSLYETLSRICQCPFIGLTSFWVVWGGQKGAAEEFLFSHWSRRSESPQPEGSGQPQPFNPVPHSVPNPLQTLHICSTTESDNCTLAGGQFSDCSSYAKNENKNKARLKTKRA